MLEQLLEQMAKGVVKFSYGKKDGEERIAFGTISRELVPVQYSGPQIQELVESSLSLRGEVEAALEAGEPVDLSTMTLILDAISLYDSAIKPFQPKPTKTSATPESEYLNYYDFEAKGWRKFHKEKLIKIF